MNSIKIEFYKTFKKLETKLSCLLLLLPIAVVYATSMPEGGFKLASSNGTLSIIDFSIIVFSLIMALYVFFIFYSIFSSSNLSKEIEDDYLSLYMPLLKSRNQLYRSKAFVTGVFIAIQSVLFVGVGIISALIFMPQGMLSGTFISANTWKYALFFLAYIIELIAFANIILAAGSYLKFMHTIFLGIGLAVVNNFVFNIPVLKYFSSEYYLRNIGDNMNALSSQSVVSNILASIAISGVVIVICHIMGQKRIKSLQL